MSATGQAGSEPASRPTSGPATGLRAEIRVDRDRFGLDIALTIEPGSTLALLGPNGAGKSTVVQALAGLVALDGGRITLAGAVLDDPGTSRFVTPELRRVGTVFQDHLLFPHLSVLDNVAFPIRHRRPRRSPRSARMEARPLIEALELEALADRRPFQLSGGQAQRVALARALAGDPALLVLDEPLAAVDVSTRGRLRPLLAERLERFGGPRLLITHDPAEAFALADRLAVIEEGRLVQEGTADDVRRHPATPWVAALTGTNLVPGSARDAHITVDGGEFVLTAATELEGPVHAIIDPRAVSLHRSQPEGSPRNSWLSTVEWVEPLGLTTRVRLGAPLPLTVDITPASAEALGLVPGREVWAAVKATEISVRPAAGALRGRGRGARSTG